MISYFVAILGYVISVFYLYKHNELAFGVAIPSALWLGYAILGMAYDNIPIAAIWFVSIAVPVVLIIVAIILYRNSKPKDTKSKC